jgi:hypothetical protein
LAEARARAAGAAEAEAGAVAEVEAEASEAPKRRRRNQREMIASAAMMVRPVLVQPAQPGLPLRLVTIHGLLCRFQTRSIL